MRPVSAASLLALALTLQHVAASAVMREPAAAEPSPTFLLRLFLLGFDFVQYSYSGSPA